jgi:hypothetical protein
MFIFCERKKNGNCKLNEAMQQNYLPSTHAEYCKSLNWNLLFRFNVCCVLFSLCSSLIQWKIIRMQLFEGWTILTDFQNLNFPQFSWVEFWISGFNGFSFSIELSSKKLNWVQFWIKSDKFQLTCPKYLKSHPKFPQKISFLLLNDLISIPKTTKCSA